MRRRRRRPRRRRTRSLRPPRTSTYQAAHRSGQGCFGRAPSAGHFIARAPFRRSSRTRLPLSVQLHLRTAWPPSSWLRWWSKPSGTRWRGTSCAAPTQPTSACPWGQSSFIQTEGAALSWRSCPTCGAWCAPIRAEQSTTTRHRSCTYAMLIDMWPSWWRHSSPHRPPQAVSVGSGLLSAPGGSHRAPPRALRGCGAAASPHARQPRRPCAQGLSVPHPGTS